MRLGIGRDQAVEVEVHHPGAALALLGGSRGLGDSYERGWWDCDDLAGLLRLLLRATSGPTRVLDALGKLAAPALDLPARLRHRPDRRRDRRNVRAHYDIGNDFYRLMLDAGMTYSCAVFEPADLSLEAAQEAKLERLCTHLGLGPDDHVVEIGSGWGGFAEHAAARHGCQVTTTTISAEQFTHTTKRIADAGLAHRVTVLDRDYRDLDGRYDKLVSVEMIEAVDWREQGEYFLHCARLLRPGGRALLQAIVIDDRAYERYKRHRDFIRTAVFPGGCLPSIGSIHAHARAAGFEPVRVERIGHHYPATLRAWHDNLRRNADRVAALGLGDRFRRRWDFYLAYCEAGFLEGRVDVVHVVLDRPAGTE
jgi:cyclopropane-fatty-acyl-phospholipid synthase